MEYERLQRHRWARWTALMLFLVLAAYPLSVGPLGLIDKANGDSPELRRIMDPYYVPLRKLPPPVRSVLARWIYLWRGEKPKS
jgi:hypothetical protein